MKIFSPVKIFLSVLLVSWVYPLWADGTKIFSLNDGSIIKGQLVSFGQGVYEVQTANLGSIRLNEQDVTSIVQEGFVAATPVVRSAAATGAAFPQGLSPELSQKMSAMQNQLLADPAMMQQVNQLAGDQDLVKILSDPAFMQSLMDAVASGNAQSVEQDPKFQKILGNPTMRGLVEQMYATQKKEQAAPPVQTPDQNE